MAQGEFTAPERAAMKDRAKVTREVEKRIRELVRQAAG